MQINVSQQLKANIGTIRNYETNSIIDVEGSEIEITGRVSLTKTNRGILVRGRFSSQIDMECSRCLCIFGYPLNFTIEEEYFPTLDIITGTSLPAPEEIGSFTIDDHNILDLSEALRQYAVLAMPIKPLCKRDCAGLCPTCGANLNETKCECRPVIDPRWEKLRNLKQDSSSL